MALNYTDKAKIVRHSWGRFRATLFETVETGDLLNFYNANNSKTMQFADESGSQSAQAVAVENGETGDTIWCALAVELQGVPTIATGGIVTAGNFADSGDWLGAPLYLGLAGKASDSAGGFSQLVGYLLERDRIILQPNTALTGVAGSFTTLEADGVVSLTQTDDSSSSTTGAVKITGGLGVAKKLYVGTDLEAGGTLVIDGASTLTGDVTQAGKLINDSVQDASSTTTGAIQTDGGLGVVLKTYLGDDLTITAGKFIVANPVKMILTAKTSSTTLTVAEAGIVTVDSNTGAVTLILPAASGQSGLRYIIKNIVVGNNIVIDGDGSETIDGATTKTNATQYNLLDIVCDGSNWNIIGIEGTWT